MSESMRSTAPDLIHVAVAIVTNSQGEILISRRLKGTHLAGLWEFPGGKVEPEETVLQALKREMAEEVGIKVKSARPLIKVQHQYREEVGEKRVLLDTWLVEQWSGEASGCEGQQIRWIKIEQFPEFEFPEADKAILKAINLPPVYQISPELEDDIESFIRKIETSLGSGVKLFQLRAKRAGRMQIKEISGELNRLCKKYQARWLINGDVEDIFEFKAHGIHLSSQSLLSLSERPVAAEFLIGASCHNLEELKHASKIDADFAVLSPVLNSKSHPEQAPLGWECFQQLVDKINLPVYALGGLQNSDQKKALSRGAQGIAMLSGLWSLADSTSRKEV